LTPSPTNPLKANFQLLIQPDSGRKACHFKRFQPPAKCLLDERSVLAVTIVHILDPNYRKPGVENPAVFFDPYDFSKTSTPKKCLRTRGASVCPEYEETDSLESLKQLVTP